MRFQEADHRYAELRRRRDAGILSEEEFRLRLKELMVRDDEGRWWAKSPTSGEWHYHNGTSFVHGNPYDRNEPNRFSRPKSWKRKEILSAVAAAVAGICGTVVIAVTAILGFAPGNEWAFVAFTWVYRIFLMSELGALVGLYARQAKSYGRLGLTGFLMASAAIVLQFGADFFPLPTTVVDIIDYSLAVGLVPLGIATLRAGVLPLWCGLAMIITAIGDAVVTFLQDFIITNAGMFNASIAAFISLYALLWLALGYALWTHRDVQATQVRHLS